MGADLGNAVNGHATSLPEAVSPSPSVVGDSMKLVQEATEWAEAEARSRHSLLDRAGNAEARAFSLVEANSALKNQLQALQSEYRDLRDRAERLEMETADRKSVLSPRTYRLATPPVRKGQVRSPRWRAPPSLPASSPTKVNVRGPGSPREAVRAVERTYWKVWESR
jgi:hypothetical protein